MENIIEFKKRIRKVTEHRKHSVRNSLGVYDCYKWIRKNKWLNIGRILTEHEFYSIIRQVNNLIAESIASGEEVTFPERMGTIELRKHEKNIVLDNGKIKTNLPIDWNATLELWYNDEESYKQKTLVRMDEEELYKLHYNTYKANFANKSFYEFFFNKDC